MKTLSFLALVSISAICATTQSIHAAVLINYTVGAAYTGAAVFGTAASQWQTYPRSSSPANLALVDDTGASTPYTLTYTRDNSGGTAVSGTYASLGSSSTHPTTAVTISGLTPGDGLSMVIYSPVGASFTIDEITRSTTGTSDWSTLTNGVNYVRFETTANNLGQVSFTSTSTDVGRTFSAFQIQSVPEPSIGLLAIGAALTFSMRRNRTRRSDSGWNECSGAR